MQQVAAVVLVFVGTYTRGESKGIYLCLLDLGTGKLSAPRSWRPKRPTLPGSKPSS